MSTDDAPKLTAEQTAHSEAVRKALSPAENGHGRWTIVVYCDDPSHEKPWEIGEFRLSTPLYDEWLSFWMFHLRGAKKQFAAEVKKQFAKGDVEKSIVEFNPAQQHIYGDREMRKPREFGVSITDADVRYRIPCKCGRRPFEWRRHRVRREDKLNLWLDRLTIVGESKISLSALDRIVAL